MARLARICCVKKTDRMNPHERISIVGGVYPDGRRWKKSVSQTIKDIESGEWEFYVEENGLTAGLLVAQHNGHKYIKTAADDIQPDNLLSLAECQ
ncbi:MULTISPECIES: DUF3892 domain-containing protein [unclassified Bradyrhizobium]|uniref:DUF3892 domain-containing protein n=1 Tax=unclassified Bradyrhizobium TaxID=2631580 RepID=UPI0020B19B4B|nr:MULTISPECIES: DUF3892 domain-containing protein [unclassified Bradyrhizobium]MCP3397116.1 DUF3892 domain-containing protein [Bradyrhizobium sp. CCGB20]MCP3405629.1 DUF3892 domain-containing protein [Bradyrhizobium sp. CCGB01]